MKPAKVEITPLWTTKMQQLLCILENPEAEPAAHHEARASLMNLAVYIDIVNSMQECVYQETLSFEDAPSTIH